MGVRNVEALRFETPHVIPGLVPAIPVFAFRCSTLILRRMAQAIRLEGGSRAYGSLLRDLASRLLLRMRAEGDFTGGKTGMAEATPDHARRWP